MKYNDYKEKTLLEDKKTEEEYEELKIRYEIIQSVINARKKAGITQKELANRMNTKQSNISRFENGEGNFSLKYLLKMAHCIGKNIKITFE